MLLYWAQVPLFGNKSTHKMDDRELPGRTGEMILSSDLPFINQIVLSIAMQEFV